MALFKKYPSMPDGFEEYGTQKDWEACCREQAAWDRKQRWKALKSLFVRKCHEENSWSYIWPYLIVGFIALVLGRGYKNKKDGSTDYGYDTVSSWDYAKLYAGWECYCLEVNLKKVRYHIFSDGDWDM